MRTSLSCEDPGEKSIPGKETNEGKGSEVEKRVLILYVTFPTSKSNPSSGTHNEPLPS